MAAATSMMSSRAKRSSSSATRSASSAGTPRSVNAAVRVRSAAASRPDSHPATRGVSSAIPPRNRAISSATASGCGRWVSIQRAARSSRRRLSTISSSVRSALSPAPRMSRHSPGRSNTAVTIANARTASALSAPDSSVSR
ncbi:Uncharacterised protein [Mycobacteroides abscessus subsp. abscessus]|nr:Uncharacterised protein [Mycobacteroides abscessus subsp. abscessus]